MALRWWRRYSPRHSQLSPGDEFDGTEDADEDDANRDNDAEFAESLENAILQLVNGVMEDEIERLVSENVKRAEDQFSQVPLIFPSFILWSKMRFQKQKLMKQSLVRLKYRGSQRSIFLRSLKIRSWCKKLTSLKKTVKKKREEEKKK